MATCTACEAHAEATFRIEGLCCQHEADLLARRLGALRGVERLSTDVVRQRIRVAYDAAVTSNGAIAAAVAETGMRAWVDRDEASAPPVSASAERRRSIALWGASTALVAGGAAYLAGLSAVAVPLLAVAVVAGGATTARRAWLAITQGRLDMYVLMSVAVIGAALIGEWIEAATVVVLFALAQALERRSLERARHAIRTLVDTSPASVRLRRAGAVVTVPLDDAGVGDVLVAGPGERIALDGIVITGASEVNQAPVTGEATPVTRVAGDRVFAGTVNGTGLLEVRVTATGDDTTLARIIHLVERAQAQRAPAQAWVDWFAARYTPLVLAIAALVATVPPLVLGESALAWGYRALVLLVIACPCALVLSTPVSIVSALAAAARRGVLIKGGLHLERLAGIRAVALDKTGTLTHGVLSVAEVAPIEGVDAARLLAIAAAIATHSRHPVDRAIAAHAATHGIAPAAVRDTTALPGEGIEATVGDAAGLLGSRRLFQARGLSSAPLTSLAAALEARGMQVVLVAHAGRGLGAIGLSDELRVHSRDAVEELRAAGIAHVALLTGDHARSAEAAARAGQVDQVHAGLLPEDKVRLVRDLRTRYGPVAMVGDGINDAPALATADVGIAMGVAGTDAAIETADVALMADDLRAVPFAIRLGRATLQTIRVNVAAALVLKAAFLALAVAGMATLWMAVAADVGASLLVVFWALRLLRVR